MSKIKPIICVSLINEGISQIRWVTIIRWRTQKCVKVNNAPSKRSHVMY
jgi:hypothetical protein